MNSLLLLPIPRGRFRLGDKGEEVVEIVAASCVSLPIWRVLEKEWECEDSDRDEDEGKDRDGDGGSETGERERDDEDVEERCI